MKYHVGTASSNHATRILMHLSVWRDLTLLEGFAVQAILGANIKLMYKIEDAETWKDSPELELRRPTKASKLARRSSKANIRKRVLLPLGMAVQPARSAKKPNTPSTSRDQKLTIIELDDDDQAAPRYAETPPTDNEAWDKVADSKRKSRRTNREAGPGPRSPSFPREQQQAWTRTPHLVERTIPVTPEYILELFHSIGADFLCLEVLYLPWTAGVLPPVTAMSLTELDLQRIMNNTKLRADINFDGDLHFRPNLDGPKGWKKCREAKEYWKALTVELLLYWVYCSKGGCCQLPSFATIVHGNQEKSFISRLPVMFQTIRAILNSLVPEQERLFVEQRFDVPLLMQQIERGCFDFKGLSLWLAQILKRHCAPMRDGMVDNMVSHIGSGVDNDVEDLVDGLKDLFGILEAMKLDVANHQIRSLRPLLIQDTVTFQQSYFLRKIGSGSISVGPAQVWYAYAREDPSVDRDSDGQRQIVLFFQALVKLLLSFDPPESFPSTFVIDVDRLWHIRSDLRDMVNLKVCDKLFGIILRRNGHGDPPSLATLNKVRYACLSILEDFDGEARWAEHGRSIALEIVRSAHDICETKDISVDLEFTENFVAEVAGSGSGCWSQLQQEIEAEILPSLMDFVDAYQHMSPLDILNHVEAPQTRTPLGSISYELECITKRIAHVGTLHWKVWAPLLYMRHRTIKSVRPFSNDEREIQPHRPERSVNQSRPEKISDSSCTIDPQQRGT